MTGTATIPTHRMLSTPSSDAIQGRVRWVRSKSLWTLAMLAAAVIGAPLTFTWGSLALFLVTTSITICAGHSVGMHRLLIHRGFDTPKWLEHSLVYLGTLVGMAGPFGMIAAHDIRDWAQRQTQCHDLFAHRKIFFHDCWWQMHCVVELDHPPQFEIEPDVRDDRFYQFIDRTYMLQQLPWAVLFYAIGGLPWLVWGIALRITISLHGHWLIGHFAHRNGRQRWVVDGVAVQGYNIPYVSLITFGESWHGNHHAFPGSAQLGVERGQLDPGWWLIKSLEWLGLAREIKTPAEVGERKGLRRVESENHSGFWVPQILSDDSVSASHPAES
jgi:fatty-acid desaturase